MLSLSLILITVMITFSSDGLKAEKRLDDVEKVVIYNWSDYMPDGILDEFTQETGIQVEYSTYSHQNILYSKLKTLRGRGYDVVFPSTDWIGVLRDEGLLQPLDHRKLSNFNKLDRSLLNKAYDPNNKYSIPYLWGSIGIGINTDKVNPEHVKSWKDLWHKRWRGQIFVIDDMVSVFYAAMRARQLDLRQAPNLQDADNIKQAFDGLWSLLRNVQQIGSEESQLQSFLSGKTNIGIVWSGTIAAVQQENPSLTFIYPEEGTSFWVDSFAIPARAKNVDNAYAFIDFMLRPEVAARCVNELGYATPNIFARKLLDDEIRNNPAIFPEAGLVAKGSFQQDVSEVQKLYKLYWEKLKNAK